MEVRRRTILVTLAAAALAVASAAAVAPTAGASAESGQTGQDTAQQRRERVLDYWTPARVRSAVPALPVLEGTPNHHRPGHAGGPGGGGEDPGDGGGDTTTTVVLGAPWHGSSATGAVGETTGKVLFTMGGTNYVCSGSTVGSGTPSIVLTAGHCVHDGNGSPNSWASMWMFIPAYEDGGSFTGCKGTPYGCWTAGELRTTSDWYAGSDFADDAGFAVMDPGGQPGETLAELNSVVGSQSIAFNTATVAEQTFAFGYPAAQKYKGRDLIYCAGESVSGPRGGGTVGLDCDMTGGSSGGPWYVSFDTTAPENGTAVSVNSHTYRSFKGRMFGPVFDGQEQAAYGGTGARYEVP